MRISEVAKQIGIPVSTIRYYEKRSIIPRPGRIGRDRDFSNEDVRAIQFVRDAQSLGLPLNEISTLLKGPWGNGEMATIATMHRNTVRERIAALNRIDEVLASLEQCRCKTFADCTFRIPACNQDD